VKRIRALERELDSEQRQRAALAHDEQVVRAKLLRLETEIILLQAERSASGGPTPDWLQPCGVLASDRAPLAHRGNTLQQLRTPAASDMRQHCGSLVEGCMPTMRGGCVCSAAAMRYRQRSPKLGGLPKCR
jgi:hypothetical protein